MTKTLFLVRHAKSSWQDSSLTDYERPLNGRGTRDAPEMGRRLAKKNIRPDLIVSSPAVRAKLTAKSIAEAINFPTRNIQWVDDVYHATPETLLAILRQTDDKHKSLMIVGHNPGLTEFQNYISSEAIENIVTAGMVSLLLEVEAWNEVMLVGKGKQLWYDFPKRPQQ